MSKNLTDEQVTALQADATRRDRIKKLFSNVPEVRADAVDALKEAWAYDQPAFNLEEISQFGPEAASLAAMRRDATREFIDWLLKL